MVAGLSEAVFHAASAHLDQVRKGSDEPFICHPLRVMQTFPASQPQHRIVAVLHDVIEDTYLTLEWLQKFGFDSEVIEAVDAISRREDETHADYIARVSENDIATSVKLADTLDNIFDSDWAPASLLKRYFKSYRLLYDQALMRSLPLPSGASPPPSVILRKGMSGTLSIESIVSDAEQDVSCDSCGDRLRPGRTQFTTETSFPRMCGNCAARGLLYGAITSARG